MGAYGRFRYTGPSFESARGAAAQPVERGGPLVGPIETHYFSKFSSHIEPCHSIPTTHAI